MKLDTNIIELLGGPKRVAEILGIAGQPGAIQRVSNWRARGIPARVLLENPQLRRSVAKLQGGGSAHAA